MRHRGDDTNGRNYALRIPATALAEYPTKSRLEMSIMINSTTTEASNICEITVGRASDGACVILPKLGLADGIVSIYDTSGNKIADVGRADEFINLTIDYHFGQKTYYVYADGVLRGSSSAAYGSNRHALPGKVTVGSASTTVADYVIDNVRFVNYK